MLLAVFNPLSSLKLLPRNLQRLVGVNGLVRKHDLLLAVFDCLLTLKLAIDDALAALELLPCLLQRFVCVDALVGEHDLLGPIKFAL